MSFFFACAITCLPRGFTPVAVLKQQASNLLQSYKKCWTTATVCLNDFVFLSVRPCCDVRFISGEITIEEIRAFAKMHEKDNKAEEKLASTIASLKHILSVTDKVGQELQDMKNAIML